MRSDRSLSNSLLVSYGVKSMPRSSRDRGSRTSVKLSIAMRPGALTGVSVLVRGTDGAGLDGAAWGVESIVMEGKQGNFGSGIDAKP